MSAPSNRAGRPRDPGIDGRVIRAAVRQLAHRGLDQLQGGAIAAEAGVGKASIYRRWRSIDALLVDVVAALGVRDVEYADGPGALRDDLSRLLYAAVSSYEGRAEAAVLSAVGRSPELRQAYARGPATRLVVAANQVELRGRRRGEPEWTSFTAVLAGHRFLLHRVAVEEEAPYLDDVLQVVDQVVLPALTQKPGSVPA